MTATDELRHLLDERGVEYDTDDEDGCEFTEWVANGLEWEADSRGELVSLMPVMLITPEQAIAATLGAGECTLESTHGYCDPYVRTAYQIELSCHTLDAWDDPVPPSYCPYCGKRVVKEDA